MAARKTNSNSKLDALSPEQQEMVFAQCNSNMSLEAGAKWLAAEFGVEISGARLGKWLEKRRIDNDFAELMSNIRADADRAQLLSREIGKASGMDEALITMLGQALFETLRSKVKSKVKLRGKAAALLSMVVEAFAKDRKSRADVLTANTQRDRFQFDAAKAALDAAADLQEISRSKGSEREKVERAITRLFGTKPENIPGMPEVKP
jgi:mevalonate kinase